MFKKINEKHLKLEEKKSGFKKEFIVKQFQLPNKLEETFFIEKARDSVAIFAMTEDNKIILVKQFRPNTETIQIELPGGAIEEGENPLEAAKRELKEETSFICNDIEYLYCNTYNPYSMGKRFFFVARNCIKEGKRDLDVNEFLSVELKDLYEVREMMKKGLIRDFEAIYVGLDRMGIL